MSGIVWSAKLDNRYEVTVRRTEPYRGKLELREGDELLVEKDVGLSYDARFGPDVMDVQEWQDFAADFVDKRRA